MRYIVTKAHKSGFPNPIVLAAGERVNIGKDPNPEENPETWVNWEYCIKTDGSNAGFVPAQIIQKEGAHGIVLEDYSAKEFDAEKGAVLEGVKEMNGWLLAKRADTGEIGWIPLENTGNL